MPAQRVDELRERLRLLAVEAQPAGTPMLAIDEEGAPDQAPLPTPHRRATH